MKLKLRKTEEYELEDNSLTLKQLTDFVWQCNNWKIVKIDGKEVIGYCIRCNVPLTSPDEYHVNNKEFTLTCHECRNKNKE